MKIATESLFEDDDAASSMGWVSNLDALLIGTVICFLFGIASAVAFAQANNLLNTSAAPIVNLTDENKQLRIRIAELEGNLLATTNELETQSNELKKLHKLIADCGTHLDAITISLESFYDSLVERDKDTANTEQNVHVSLDQGLLQVNNAVCNLRTNIYSMVAEYEATALRTKNALESLDSAISSLRDSFLNDPIYPKDESILKNLNRSQVQRESPLETQVSIMTTITTSVSQATTDSFRIVRERVRVQGEEIAQQKKKIAELETQLAKSRQKVMPKEPVNEFGIRRELLGIKETVQFNNVAVVVDTSGSMKQNANGKGWEIAKRTFKSWVQHLGMERCTLISYSNEVKVSQTRSLVGDSQARHQAELFALIDELKPEGGTNTLDALRKAYELNPSAIVLFTDGEPTKSGEKDTSKIVSEIIDLATSQPEESRVPIIVVGIGDYAFPVCASPVGRADKRPSPDAPDKSERIFDSSQSQWSPGLLKFLQDLADQTGGTFIGRDYYPAETHAWWQK